jgi:hypothetical protein
VRVREKLMLTSKLVGYLMVTEPKSKWRPLWGEGEKEKESDGYNRVGKEEVIKEVSQIKEIIEGQHENG